MTNQHRATPEQWAQQALWVETYEDSSCIMELRARIEALEAAQPHQDKLDRLMALDADDGDSIVMPSSPADLLIDRVAKAIYYAPGTNEGWGRSGARAAILEVAAWMLENRCGYNAARWLEREANQ